MTGERKIGIGRDANDNVIITGDGNFVIVQATRSLEIAATAPVVRSEIGPNPYRGLEVFREEHADRYFGREALTDKLWTIFRELHQMPAAGPPPLRLLPVIGPSGSGKSSLARAGLIAELARRPLPSRSEARVGVITPGGHPIESLALVLARIATGDQTPVGKTSEFAQRLRSPAASGEFDGLRFIADLLSEIAAKPLILLVDQFEETYSLCDDAAERDAFVGNLLHAAGAVSARVSIVLTLRSDFLGATNRHPALSHALAERAVLVPVMSEAELRRAIEQPALNAGHPIDAATVELLVAQTAGREGALPLLQFALTRIWDGMANGIAPAQTVKDLGGVGGALAREAQQLYDGLSDADKRIARRAFLAMVRLGEGTLDTRRRAAVPEIVGQGEDPDRVMAVLRVFSQPDKRLVTLSAEADAISTAEVTHEALLEDWSLLRDWLAAGRDDIRFHRRLAEAAEHWDEQRRPHGLLWRRPDLDLLRSYHVRSSGEMTATQVAFFTASARQHRRARIMRQVAVLGLAGLAIIALAFAIYAENQRRLADEQRQIAETAKAQAESAQRLANELRDEAEQARDRATQEKARADEEAIKAKAQRDNALITQSLFLAELSQRETAADNATNGILLALAGLPSNLASADRPYVAEAEVALYIAINEEREGLVLSGHVGALLSAAFSPEGRRVLTASQDGTARLWDVATGTSLAVLRGHEDGVVSAAFSLDGRRVVTASRDNTARLWDATTGKRLAVLTGHTSSVTSAAFSPDGQRVVTASYDKTVRLWDAASGRSLAVLSGHEGAVRSAAFSPDGQRVVTASFDKTARLWDAASGKSLAVLSGHEDSVLSGAFSPSGQRLVTASRDGTARLWDTASGKSVAVLSGHDGAVVSAAFSPDGQRVVTASYDKTARLWDAASGKTVAVLSGHDGAVVSAAFSPDGQRVVTASDDQTARLWDAASGQHLAMLKGHGDAVLLAAFSPDGQRVVTASADNTARLWNAASGPSLAVLKDRYWIRSAAFSPDGQRVVTVSLDNTARLWDADSGQSLAALRGHEGAVMSVAFSPDGQRVVTASYDRTARVWDAASGQSLAVLSGHENPVLSVAFSPDGHRVVTASRDGTARLWDAASGKSLAVLSGHESDVTSAAFSPDGQRIVTVSLDSTARLWDAASGENLFVLNAVSSAAFSPDGQRVLTASEDNTARLWDAASGQSLAVLTGHAGRVNSAAFSPDGQRVVTASEDKTVRLWDAASGQSLAVLSGHKDGVVSAAFSPDGRRVVTASRDNTARLWDAASGKALATLSGHADTVWSAAFSPDGQRVVTASSDNTARLWAVLPAGQALIDYGRSIVPRQLTPEQRKQFFLEAN